MGFLSARLSAGKTQAEVAQHMEVSTSAVSQWENGVVQPTAKKLLKIAEFYGCSVEELLRKDKPHEG